MPQYRSRTTTHGRNMAGARALWRATGMKDGDFDKPIIAVANSFTQFVPGHVHLKDLGQLVAREIERAGGVAKEFNTIAVDDGIARVVVLGRQLQDVRVGNLGLGVRGDIDRRMRDDGPCRATQCLVSRRVALDELVPGLDCPREILDLVEIVGCRTEDDRRLFMFLEGVGEPQ